MEEKKTSLRHRIPNDKRQECLKLIAPGQYAVVDPTALIKGKRRESVLP